jgi:peptidoglycan hydrolase CwlO-like protein
MEVTMKRMLLAVSGMTLLMSGLAFAQAETPRIDQRQANQEQRIDQGIASGQLNEREANRLNKQQEHINKMEARAKSDGVMTKKERARIVAAQDRASRHIAREKHDRQGKRHR